MSSGLAASCKRGLPWRCSPANQNAIRAGVLIAFALALPQLSVAQPGPSAQQEIQGLLQAIAASRCSFIRGGTAYSGAQAREHLKRKFDHMSARGMLHSAEDFIALAATRSSMTGQGYAIQCQEALPQKSDEWMRLQLQALRQASSKP